MTEIANAMPKFGAIQIFILTIQNKKYIDQSNVYLANENKEHDDTM